MRKGKQFMVLGLGLLVLVGGCGTDAEQTKKAAGEETGKKEIFADGGFKLKSEDFVSIQDYIGEGYELKDGEKNDEIAEAHKEEIETAVKAFFLEKYKTKVTVYNMVGAKEGVSVFVESIGEPHFYTFAIVPINEKTEKVETDRVWSQEGQVENAITSALYAVVYEEEFAKLDEYLNQIVDENPVIGMRKEALERVGARGYATEYYYVGKLGTKFDNMYNQYINNPKIGKEELRESLNRDDFEANQILITITLFMEDVDSEPDQQLYDKMVKDITEMEGIPKGSYSIILHDNLINKKYASGSKESSLDRTVVNEIIKE